MQNIAEVLRKIAQYSLADKAGFETLVKNSLAKGQTDEMKKQQKRILQITHRLEQIEKVMDKLYEDNALGAIEPDRYEQLSQKYAEEYYPLKKELEEIRQLENKRRQLVQEQKAQERRDRTEQLCRRMGLFESLVPDTITLTEEQFKTFLEQTVATEHSRRISGGRENHKRI